MPGIAGIIKLKKGEDVSSQIDININSFSKKLLHYDWYKTQSFDNDDISIKGIITGLTQQKSIKEYKDGITIAFIGELFNSEAYEINFFDYIKETYLKEHSDFLLHLNGTFSLLIHDKNKDTTIVAVDRVASKPIFYSMINNNIYISSELKSFSNIKGYKYELEESAIADVLSHGFVINNRTFFKNILELPNGHYIEVKNGQLKICKYWDFSIEENKTAHNYQYYFDTLIKLLDISVKRRIRNDIPTAILLSGGIDSRAILAYYSKYAQKPITISYGSKRELWNNYSDTIIAEKVAEFYNTQHFFMEYDLDKYYDTIKKVTRISDGLSRVLPEFEIYQKIRRELGILRVYTGDNDFGRFRCFIGDDEQMMETANYINYFNRYCPDAMFVSEEWYKKLCIASKRNIDELLSNCKAKKFHNRKDYFFLISYMISLIGKDRSTIMSELEIVNPWYDADILNFVKSLPLKYRMDKKLFRDVVNLTFPELSKIEMARTVTKPTEKKWKRWFDENSDEIYDEIRNSYFVKNKVFDLKNIENKTKELLTNKTIKESLLVKIKKSLLPDKSKYNWITSSAPFFVYKNSVKILEKLVKIKDFLIFKGIKNKRIKKAQGHHQMVNLLRLHLAIKLFNLLDPTKNNEYSNSNRD